MDKKIIKFDDAQINTNFIKIKALIRKMIQILINSSI